MIQIIPGILATNEEDFKEQFNKVVGCLALQDGWLQIDLMDGEFVESKSIGADTLKKYSADFKKEIQLLVKDPNIWLDSLEGYKFNRAIAPAEIGEDLINKFILKCQHSSITPGLSLNPQTSIETLSQFMSKIEYVLVMSVNPGFQGQEFIQGSIDKIKKIREIYPDIKIGVDGGVKTENIKDLTEAGINYAIVGSGLLKGDIDENLEKFWEAIALKR